MRSAKKLITALLLVLLCMSLLAVSAFAADGDELPAVPAAPTVVDSGTCGENLTWSLDSAGTLTVSGTGPMTDFGWGGAPWWNYRESVTAVVIGEGVTQVGSRAFLKCENMTSLSLPGTLEVIRLASFSECNNLRSVTLPDSLTTIEGNAFDCCGMQTITIPRNVTEINSYAFHYCGDLEEILVDENNPVYSDANGVLCNKDQTVVILAPDGLTGSYTIPDTVTMIGGLAFDCCYKLTDVVFGEGVTFIEDSAFYDCANLKNVTFSDSLVTIGFQAFHLCSALDNVTLPASLEAIETSAFAHCSSMTEITIPAKVQSIGSLAFNGCRSLTGFGVDAANPWFTADQYGVLFSKDMTTLVAAPGTISGTYVIPDGTVTLQGGAFIYCENLEAVTIPEGVKALGSNAFGYTNLTEVTLPASVTYAGSHLFSGCQELKKVTFLGSAPIIENDVFYEVTAEIHYPVADISWNQDVQQNYGGSLTWVPDGDVQSLEVITDLLCYTVGDTVNPADIQINAVYEGGVRVEVDPAKLTLGQCDLSTVGLKTLSVSYGGCSADIKVAVHNQCMGATSDPSLWPESDHDYGNDLDDIQTITLSGAEKLVLTFSTQTWMEYNCDFIYLYDGNDNLIASYTGDEASGITVTVPGDTVRVRLTTDVSVTGYGYSFTDIEGRVIAHVGNTPAEDAEPTCTKPGHTGGIYCTICQAAAKYTTIPALGHDYEAVVTAPTLEANGYTTYTCTHCGDSYTDDVTQLVANGTCGDNLTWVLDDAGALTISGTGKMMDYSYEWDWYAPWYSYRDSITSVSVEPGVTTIGDVAFYKCANLTSISIPDSVVSIGERAFNRCTSLTDITIPDSVVEIGILAFTKCESLADEDGFVIVRDVLYGYYGSADTVVVPNGVTAIDNDVFWKSTMTGVTIPDSVTSIGAGAFSFCTSLTDVIIPDSVTSIGTNAFRRCDSLADEDGFIIVRDVLYGYIGAASDIIIPDAVTVIDEDAFIFCDILTSVVIPSGVTTIRDDAFNMCTNLTDVTIPGTVTSVGEYAFYECTSLKNLMLSEGLTTIGDYAFNECKALTDLTIPSTVTFLGQYAFADCDGLADVVIPADVAMMERAFHQCDNLNGIWVSPDNQNYSSDEYGALYNKNKTVLFQVMPTTAGHYRVPDGVTEINMYAFYGGDSLTSVTFPDSLAEIGHGTFVGCDSLSDVYYAGSESDWSGIVIDSDNECLINATIHFNTATTSGICGDNLTWELDDNGVLTISGSGDMYDYRDYYASEDPTAPWYPYANDINKIVIEEGVTGIGKAAFVYCMNVDSVSIPSTVTEIRYYAFHNCTALTDLVIPEGVVSIGERAFNYTGLRSVELPSSLREIGTKAFHESSLLEVYIPENVSSIGENAFGSCNKLTGIWVDEENNYYCNDKVGALFNKSKTKLLAIPANLTRYDIPQGVEYIDAHLAYFHMNLEIITIPSSVAYIGEYAFACTKLTSVVLPVGVKELGYNVFCGCDYLTSVVLPEGLEYIGSGAFDGCKALTSVTIPQSVQYISMDTFANCDSLEKIVLPDKLLSISDHAFYNCTSLNHVIIPVTVEYIASNAFLGCESLTDVYYTGSEADWEKLILNSGNEILTGVTIHYNYRKQLSTPSVTKLENVANGIKVTWGAVEGAERYRVYIKSGNGWLRIGDTTGTSLVYTGAKGGQTYTFTVRCVDADGKFTSDYNATGWSQKFMVRQPSVTKLENVGGGIKITWGAVSGAERYRVFVKVGSGWQVVGSTTGTSFTYTGAKSGQSYTFTVRCMDASDKVFASAYNTTGWTKKYVAQPSVTKLENVSNGIKITWGAVSGAERYRVFVKTSSGWQVAGNTTGTSFTYTGAKSGQSYIFTVRCVDAKGSFTSSYNTTGWSQKYIGQPKVSKLENVSNGIKITWGAVSGAERYRVFVKTSSGWQSIGSTTGTSFVYTGAKSGQTYTFTVRCVNAADKVFTSSYNGSGWSQKYIAQPSITKLQNVSGGIKLTWNAVSGAERYRVFVKTSSGWQSIGSTTGTSFTFTGAKKGETYTFTVRCVNAADKVFTSSYNKTGWAFKKS